MMADGQPVDEEVREKFRRILLRAPVSLEEVASTAPKSMSEAAARRVAAWTIGELKRERLIYFDGELGRWAPCER